MSSARTRALRMAGLTARVSGSYVGYLLQRAFLAPEARDRKRRAVHARAGRTIRDELVDLRGPVMKLGQALSMSTGALPPEVIAELTSLQMQAPGMHASLAAAQFKASLGRAPDEVFRRFDPEPFAAASLGQVHRAWRRDGTELAVKVQYPGIRQAIEHDFLWIRRLALPARVSGHVPPAALDEVESQILAETDYRREADDIDAFREGLRPLTFVTLPRVYRDLSTDRVLTMSRVPGDHIDAWLAKRPSQKLRDLVGSRLLELFYFQILRLEALHADPHWGNYLFNPDGTLGLVDFGCVKRLGRDVVRELRRSFLYAGPLEAPEFQRIIQEQFGRSRQPLTPAVSRAVVEFSRRFYRKVYPPDPRDDGRVFDFSDAAFIREYLQASANLARVKGAAPHYIFLARAEIGLYQTLHRLEARVATSTILRRLLQAAHV